MTSLFTNSLYPLISNPHNRWANVLWCDSKIAQNHGNLLGIGVGEAIEFAKSVDDEFEQDLSESKFNLYQRSGRYRSLKPVSQ